MVVSTRAKFNVFTLSGLTILNELITGDLTVAQYIKYRES